MVGGWRVVQRTHRQSFIPSRTLNRLSIDGRTRTQLNQHSRPGVETPARPRPAVADQEVVYDDRRYVASEPTDGASVKSACAGRTQCLRLVEPSAYGVVALVRITVA